MKICNWVLGALAVSSIVGGTSTISAQSQISSSRSFTLGNYQFRAQQTQNNGLLRGVTIYKVSNYQSPEPTVIIYAKFARQDRRNLNRWILGNVVMHQIGGKNFNYTNFKAEQLTLNVDK